VTSRPTTTLRQQQLRRAVVSGSPLARYHLERASIDDIEQAIDSVTPQEGLSDRSVRQCTKVLVAKLNSAATTPMGARYLRPLMLLVPRARTAAALERIYRPIASRYEGTFTTPYGEMADRVSANPRFSAELLGHLPALFGAELAKICASRGRDVLAERYGCASGPLVSCSLRASQYVSFHDPAARFVTALYRLDRIAILDSDHGVSGETPAWADLFASELNSSRGQDLGRGPHEGWPARLAECYAQCEAVVAACGQELSRVARLRRAGADAPCEDLVTIVRSGALD
jgi:hypothetical protein